MHASAIGHSTNVAGSPRAHETKQTPTTEHDGGRDKRVKAPESSSLPSHVGKKVDVKA